VLISEAVWQSRWGGVPDILERSVRVNGEPSTIIGVMPADFEFPEETRLWTHAFSQQPEEGEDRDTRYLTVTARLQDGETLAAAQQELEVLLAGWRQDYPDIYEGLEFQLETLRQSYVREGEGRVLYLMMGAVLLVLLIACVNVANLLLVRGGFRAKEMAIRNALGVSRARAIRLLLLESLVLAAGGALVGLPLAGLSLEGLIYVYDETGQTVPSWMDMTINGPVLVYVCCAVVGTCVVAGLMPALRLVRTDLSRFLNEGTRGSSSAASGHITQGLVVVQVALSCVLLVVSGLMVRSVIEATRIPLGYEPEGIMTARLGLPQSSYDDVQLRQRFFTQLTDNLQARPEVTAAGISSRLPTWSGEDLILPEGATNLTADTQPEAGAQSISPGWLDVMEVEVIDGRRFEPRDRDNPQSLALINETMARLLWPEDSAVGRRFSFNEIGEEMTEPWIEVIGVIPDLYQGEFDEPLTPQVYLYAAQNKHRFYSLFLRTHTGDPGLATSIMREEVRRLEPDLPIYWVNPMQHHIDRALFDRRIIAFVFGKFGAIALLLAGVGIYGVMAYSVSQRTAEIGVRVALGATPEDIMRSVLHRGGGLLLAGLVLGLGLSLGASRLVAFILYGVSPGDLPTYLVTLVILLAAGLLACWIPARRALRISPIDALRHE
jgi:putative ABC transport system permease protein